MNSRHIQAGDVRLHLREWGERHPTTLVLVHGYPDSSHVWDKVATLLAEHYHVVAYDVRGAGKSDAPAATGDYSLEHLAADFRAVIDAVSPDQPIHLIAHDWGSIQSWESVTDPALANRIASFTSISGPCLDHAGYWIAQRLKSGRPDQIGQVGQQIAHSWYVGAFHLPVLGPGLWQAGLDKLWPGILARLEGQADKHANPSQQKDGRHGIKLYRANFIDRLTRPQDKRTDVPVQLIVPTRDPFVSTELLADLHQWAPALWRQDVDAGHWLPISDPTLVANKVSQFVDYIAGGAKPDDAPPDLRRSRVRGPHKPYSGQLVIVTGAGSGIGRETLLSFAEQGAAVLAVDRDEAALARTVELAQLLDAEAAGYQLDVSDAQAWDAFAAWADQNHGTPNILVNNAGIGMAGGFLDTSRADWERLLKTNLWSVIHGASLFARRMAAARQPGHIVNVASAAAFTPARSLTAYSTSKAAVRMLSDCMRADLAEHHIHVLSVCPGVINTGITQRTDFVGLDETAQASQRQRATDLYSRRNLGPRAVANAILKGLDNGRDEVLIGAEAYGLNLLNRLAPALGRRLARMSLTG